MDKHIKLSLGARYLTLWGGEFELYPNHFYEKVIIRDNDIVYYNIAGTYYMEYLGWGILYKNCSSYVSSSWNTNCYKSCNFGWW